MPFTENDIKSELSYAYLHAVAARAGFGCECTGRHSDNAGVDAYIRVRERLAKNATHTRFAFEVQLKATSKITSMENGCFSFWLDDVARYDNLRVRAGPMPTLLIVLFLPEDPAHWLQHTEELLIARRCAYWVSLWDAPSSANKSGQTIYLPQENQLSVAGLRDVARRLALQEELVYAS